MNLPEAGTTSTETKGVVVTVDSQETSSSTARRRRATRSRSGSPSAIDASEVKRVVLQGDRDVILGDVVWILDQARSAGAEEVAIAATRPSKGS